ncbi:hypothetical protein SAMN06264365_12715 [Actinoplanes regularis]|uniref:Uncharacterized protein n=1 Tax=Actinoplanes regularis TaxID=52697 RepID=A0A239I2E7_9ACTN|nr:hypothetical protein SAMN06264365_12715 [Actinoplanes regularis]
MGFSVRRAVGFPCSGRWGSLPAGLWGFCVLGGGGLCLPGCGVSAFWAVGFSARRAVGFRVPGRGVSEFQAVQGSPFCATTTSHTAVPGLLRPVPRFRPTEFKPFSSTVYAARPQAEPSPVSTGATPTPRTAATRCQADAARQNHPNHPQCHLAQVDPGSGFIRRTPSRAVGARRLLPTAGRCPGLRLRFGVGVGACQSPSASARCPAAACGGGRALVLASLRPFLVTAPVAACGLWVGAGGWWPSCVWVCCLGCRLWSVSGCCWWWLAAVVRLGVAVLVAAYGSGWVCSSAVRRDCGNLGSGRC